MTGYLCPCCHSRLKKDFYHGKICFRCTSCSGVFAMLPAIRSLCSSRDFVNHLWMKARNSYESRINCPICRKPMKLVRQAISQEHELELDVCCSCQEIWFDAGELEAVPLKVENPPELLPQKAREILAMEQIKNVSVPYSPDGNENAPSNPLQTIAAVLGFPVEVDAPKLRSLPLVTWTMAALCIALFILNHNAPEVINQWGMIPNDLFRNYGANIFTSLFLHGSIVHLLGNIYFLLIFGDNVEDYLGKAYFLLFIIFSVLFSLGAHLLLRSNSAVPCIGINGIVSGIIAMYAMLFPQVKLNFLFHCGRGVLRRHIQWIQIPAAAAFVLWVIFQFIVWMLFEKSYNNGIAFSAHLGGTLCGFTCGLVLCIAAKSRSENKEN